jgi:GDP-L-galactose phosphorylase
MLARDAAQGLFKYGVSACPTRVLPGVFGFIGQLNEGRWTKHRPTEFRLDEV